ncbi:hypothetical protein AB0K47_29340 [Streptomyces tirandamycinicus]|uniref:Uncharacterized protein n=1 Tax=Streptomyces tirandamycinicus TaxID=2174846 RepID=A0A2S1SZH4_9ACTN|nr:MULTISPECIES: hypothetical protein [Streptomyces]AWI31814.1 hypothetical protein DDW44_25755 [Streptomyces tirandamycinicus]MCY0981307.1 hypothetical protein [Streptomyces tirandamycinicus]NNJ07222.1 hypothetical protein [Streptomyces sp. PKU-MA01144]TFE49825.1 hypothetical protein E3E14_15170 [Streptomyces sp. ICN441]
MIQMLHEKGLRSEHAYTAAFVSIGLSILAWTASRKAEPGAGLDRADRWGIFVGEWAPTFFGLGLALSHYEQHDGTLVAGVHDIRKAQSSSKEQEAM